MSGFWLQGDKFVTAAHFLDVQEGVQDHQKSDTITYLKSLKHIDIDDSANGLRARVSSEVWAAGEQDYDNGDDMRVFHVYLHSLNSEADIAIFRILPGEKHRPQHAIREDQLSTSAAMNPHTLHNSLFSVFYAGNDRPIAEYRTSDPLKEAKARNSGCEKVFEFLARDSAKQQKLSDRDTMHVPTFEEVFLPGTRESPYTHKRLVSTRFSDSSGTKTMPPAIDSLHTMLKRTLQTHQLHSHCFTILLLDLSWSRASVATSGEPAKIWSSNIRTNAGLARKGP